MNSKYIKIIIALSLTLILCSCGTPVTRRADTAEPASEEIPTIAETTSAETITEETSSEEAAAPEYIPEYTIETIDQIMYAQNAVNLREGPSTDYAKFGSLYKGEEVHVIGQASTGWYQLENSLFVSNSYLGDNAPEPEPVPEPASPQGSAFSQESAPAQSAPGEHPFIAEVVNLVNAERANAGLSPLTLDSTVQAVATVRVNECVQSFSHTRPDGSSFATALDGQGASYSSAGENIAYGQTTPQEVVDAWMNSSGHRDNIMNAAYTCIGVGYCEDAQGTDYWCQVFTG